MDPLTNQASIEQFVLEEIIKDLDPSSIEILRRGGLTQDQLDNVHNTIKKIAEKASAQFGNLPTLSDLNLRKLIKQEFSILLSSVIETVGNQAPDLICEAGLGEAVFSHHADNRPILTTDSLATCIGVAGYHPQKKFGFVIHFINEEDVKASGEMLAGHICNYIKDSSSPLVIHLRGGIKGLSEPLLASVQEWIASINVNYVIASENTLQEPLIPGTGLPKIPGSIKLDVRTGACETYDSKTNPYSFKKRTENQLEELLNEVAIRKPQIEIVYNSLR